MAVLAYDEQGRLLLIQDKPSGLWGFPGGIIDPLEQPADAAVRETWEEAGVLVELTKLIGVFAGNDFSTSYENGDQVSCVATVFSARFICGTPRPDGVETADARFFSPQEIDNLPCLPHFLVIHKATSQSAKQAYFMPSSWKPQNV